MIKVGVVGGTGYTGIELLRLLSMHPEVELITIVSRQNKNLQIKDIYPSLRSHIDLYFSSFEDNELENCHAVFFATPAGVSMLYVKKLLSMGIKVLDLSADFRLKNSIEFEQWYGIPHLCPEILFESVYGLVEINREKIKNTNLVSVPGCYPTSISLGFAPLLHYERINNRKLIDQEYLIADAKSGVSGSGRVTRTDTVLSESAENFKAYNIYGHRHYPEIKQILCEIADHKKLDIVFVPHLLPIIRGIFSTLYVRILPGGKNFDYQSLYEDFYKNESFIDVMPANSLPEIKSVRGSNMLRIAVYQLKKQDTLIILVVEDNLIKGASGQSIQCMNLMFGFPENMGLNQIALFP